MALKLGYITLSVLVFVLLILIGNYAINKSTDDEKLKSKRKRTLLISMLLWQVYVFLIGSSGFLANFSLPPRMPLLLILPLFLFTGIFLYQSRNKKWITSIPPLWLTAYQSFRIIVETLFVLSIPIGVLHKNVTIQGYNYDMIVGLTAPIIAFIVYRSRKTPRKLLIGWNYFGLGVLACTVFVFITTAFVPQFYGFEATPLAPDFGLYPYVLVPALLMPSAVFIHILSLIQLYKSKPNN